MARSRGDTRQVAVQTSIVSGIDLPVAGAPDGPDTVLHYYETEEEAFRLLETLVGQLVNAQVRPNDIAVLSTRRLENSLLAGRPRVAGHRLFEAERSAQPRRGDLLFSTTHAFKGLERQAVLAIDMAEIGEDVWRVPESKQLAAPLVETATEIDALQLGEGPGQQIGRAHV